MTAPETRQAGEATEASEDAGTLRVPVARTRAEEDDLLARWLHPDPNEPWPAGWRVTARGPQLWALAGYLEEALDAAATDPPAHAGLLEMAAQDFALPREAVSAALVFYRRHRAAIDAVAELNRPPATVAGAAGVAPSRSPSGPAAV